MKDYLLYTVLTGLVVWIWLLQIQINQAAFKVDILSKVIQENKQCQQHCKHKLNEVKQIHHARAKKAIERYIRSGESN